MSWAKQALEEAHSREAAAWRPLLVRLIDEEKAWFAAHPGERELFRPRRPGGSDALPEQEDLMGVSVVPIGGGRARVQPEARWRYGDE